jgi:putative toxin-antitoxin system antitoxin component (TIGR02293 family)
MEDNRRMTATAISEVLGGRKMLRRRVECDFELIALTRAGLPVQTLTRVAEELNVERKELARIVGISERTLSRRMGSGERLTAEESDRTVRLARVVAHARKTFGTTAKAALWLQTPNRALEGQKPLTMLDTDSGAREVDTILGRIEYGLYS